MSWAWDLLLRAIETASVFHTSPMSRFHTDAAGSLSGSFDSIVSNGASVTAGRDATRFYVVVQ